MRKYLLCLTAYVHIYFACPFTDVATLSCRGGYLYWLSPHTDVSARSVCVSVYLLAELTIREIEFMLLLVGREISTCIANDSSDACLRFRQASIGNRNVYSECLFKRLLERSYFLTIRRPPPTRSREDSCAVTSVRYNIPIAFRISRLASS